MSQKNIKSDMESRRTVYPGRQVIHLWANDCPRDLRGGSLSTWNESTGNTLRSYAAPIACLLPATVRTPDGCRIYLLRDPFYSKTTAKHLSHARGALPALVRFGCAEDWNGLAETLPASVPGAVSGVPSHARFAFYGVRNVRPVCPVGHADNYAALFNKAVDELSGLRTALKYGSPGRVADLFAVAEYYRRTFTPAAAPHQIPTDAPAILSGFRKRREAAAAREAEAGSRLRGARAAWLESFTATAEVIRAAYAAAVAGQLSAATLAEKIAAWEAGAPWPAEAGRAEGEATEALRRIVRALLAGRANEAREHSGVPEAVRAALPCPATALMRGAWPQGKGGRHDYGSDRAFWDLCGVDPYGVGQWSGRVGLSIEPGRDLVRLTADGGEVITSGGARVPASIARLLWKRFGALMSEAATAEAAPAFPGDGAPIPFGPFQWTGWEAATPEARASGGGAWALRVGCHRICAADLCRMAARHAWEGGCK